MNWAQMSLSHEHVGPKILGKIKIYVLIRAELLFPLCYEIPCITTNTPGFEKLNTALFLVGVDYMTGH